MYVRRTKLARAHRLGAVRGIRGVRGLADDGGGIDWGSIITTGIQTAGNVAQVALKPPTYSSVTTPYGTSVQAYGTTGQQMIPSGLGTSSLDSISPVWLLLGAGLLAVVLLRR